MQVGIERAARVFFDPLHDDVRGFALGNDVVPVFGARVKYKQVDREDRSNSGEHAGVKRRQRREAEHA